MRLYNEGRGSQRADCRDPPSLADSSSYSPPPSTLRLSPLWDSGEHGNDGLGTVWRCALVRWRALGASLQVSLSPPSRFCERRLVSLPRDVQTK